MRLKDTISYNPETGRFIWLVSARTGNRKIAGNEAKGVIANNGYIHIKVNRAIYLAHRLAWYLSYEIWPKHIDHINRDKLDNRLCNLRDVEPYENSANCKNARKNGPAARPAGNRKRPWIRET